MPPAGKTPAIEKTFVVEFDGLPSNFHDAVHGQRDDVAADGTLPAVEIVAPLRSDTCSGYIQVLPSVIADARRAAAEMLLDRAKFTNAAEYAAAVGKLAERVRPAGLGFPETPGLVRYEVDATYGGFDGGPFGDSVYARTAEEAEFLIRQTMTENTEYADLAKDPHGFAGNMGSHRIHKSDVRPSPYSEREVKAALADLVREAQAAGHSGPALELARKIAETYGFEVDAAAAPGMGR